MCSAADFLKRIQHYEKDYETLCLEKDEEYSFLKMINGMPAWRDLAHRYGPVYEMMSLQRRSSL
jgi:hypothetical protein